MSGGHKSPSNVKMGATQGEEGAPLEHFVQKREYDGWRMKPKLFEDIQPVLLARVHPEAAEAADKAGESAALAIKQPEDAVANVDVPREESHEPKPAGATPAHQARAQTQTGTPPKGP